MTELIFAAGIVVLVAGSILTNWFFYRLGVRRGWRDGCRQEASRKP